MGFPPPVLALRQSRFRPQILSFSQGGGLQAETLVLTGQILSKIERQ